MDSEITVRINESLRHISPQQDLKTSLNVISSVLSMGQGQTSLKVQTGCSGVLNLFLGTCVVYCIFASARW